MSACARRGECTRTTHAQCACQLVTTDVLRCGDALASRPMVPTPSIPPLLVACRACVTSARRVQGVCVGAVTDGNTDVSRAAAVGELFDFAVT
eukprot:CAMPEP_0119365570 /NCGR_PEP_ID=MMETSP1334-20130426/12501_1 /TAXON_ID=127549 /ORGANISM="Calcidiscus leptoporus, Strain RCC1130" /LENGTH=92 /DNA_ID=CAMNT_0007381583 /DNA_START=392 /DNA_END=666 /DNA_ORIENTATION=-